MVSKLGSKRLAVLGMSLLALTLAGCASSLDGGTYGRGEARSAMNVQYGTIQSIRPVRIEGTKTPIGPIAGAAVGGIAGSGVGGGRGQSIATVLGAVAGGAAGAAVEEGVTRRAGLEISVRLDSGRDLAVVQEDGGEGFQPGQRVRVVCQRCTMRVSH